MKKKHLLLIFLNIVCANLFAQTWNGNTSTDWNTASNWSPANVPTASGAVTIPGSLTRYPVLATDVTIKSINMAAGSALDFKGKILNIISANNFNYIIGATLNNSDGGSDIIINLNMGPIGAGYESYIRNITVNDNITFNLLGTAPFKAADIGGSENTYKGNVVFNAKEAMVLSISNGSASQFEGNLTINRTVAGTTSTVFGAGGTVSGNFIFINNLDGATYLGNLSIPTNINGKVDINFKPATPAVCKIYRLINKTTGGIINVQNTLGFDVQQDTLKVNSLSLTGYRGQQFSEFYNNDITGILTIANDVSYGSATGYGSYIRSNKITGKTNITIDGYNVFYEADNTNSGNYFKGDVSYTITSTASVYMSHGDTSKYDGNLTINRSGKGLTQAFNFGAIIGGNFSFNNNTAGNVIFGNPAKRTSVGGMVDISINDNMDLGFEMYRVINQTTGGTINVQNTHGMNVQQDTLKVSSLSITNFRGQEWSYFIDNHITGNLSLSSDKTYGTSTGYETILRSNNIIGNTNITINGYNPFKEADISNSGNHFTGDVSYTLASTGFVYMSHGDASRYDGNLTINRSANGFTQAFNYGAIIGGNFSFNNNTAGNVIFGNPDKRTSVGGMVDISINDIVPTTFELYRMINQTKGGTIDVQNTLGFNVQQDTLMVNSLSITGYRGQQFGYLINNNITGNLTIADDASYGSSTGYYTYIASNDITGNATFTKNGINEFFDANGGNTGNHYTGNVAYNKNAIGTMNVAVGDTNSIGGGLSLNSTAININKIQFTGNDNGVVQQAGSTPIVIPTLIMNKGGKSKITLMDTLKVTTNLNLISGIIETGVNSNLVLPDNMTYLGGSDSSYVDGPMLKIGNDAFSFPLGQKNAYAPITITAPGAITDQFRAQYKNEQPGLVYDSTQKDASLNHISRAEYWLLDRTAGTSNVSVTIGWAPNRSGVVNDIPSLRVTRWDGSKWKDLGHGTTTGTNAMGTIQTAAAVTSFSPFTLASTTALNPLPINISRFGALRQSSSVFLNWSTENEINFSHFEVERSGSDNNFSSIGEVTAHNITTLQSYTLEDKNPLKGTNLYRLKLVDRDGKVMYSKVVSVIYNERSAITIYPNPARDYILVDGVKVGMAIEINDASGKIVKRFIANASNKYVVSDLHKGLYFVKIQDKENATVTKLIIE